jgi:hypothetical protein
MLYALAVLTLSMMGYMWWVTAFQMRRDRLRTEKSADRSHVIMTPKQRARVQLMRAFRLSDDKPDWESRLVKSLATEERRKEKA